MINRVLFVVSVLASALLAHLSGGTSGDQYRFFVVMVGIIIGLKVCEILDHLEKK